jgi:hypothetical protein
VCREARHLALRSGGLEFTLPAPIFEGSLEGPGALSRTAIADWIPIGSAPRCHSEPAAFWRCEESAFLPRCYVASSARAFPRCLGVPTSCVGKPGASRYVAAVLRPAREPQASLLALEVPNGTPPNRRSGFKARLAQRRRTTSWERKQKHPQVPKGRLSLPPNPATPPNADSAQPSAPKSADLSL